MPSTSQPLLLHHPINNDEVIAAPVAVEVAVPEKYHHNHNARYKLRKETHLGPCC